MISDDYKELNRKLHETNEAYGTSGEKWAQQVQELAGTMDADTVLDYGCGKQTLAKALPHLLIDGYDPCLEGLDAEPEPADLVVCTDVLEHIEPDHIDAVMDDLKRVTKKMIFISIATIPAMKTLEDGRNAHLLVMPSTWWLVKVLKRFELRMFQSLGPEFALIAAAYPDMSELEQVA